MQILYTWECFVLLLPSLGLGHVLQSVIFKPHAAALVQQQASFVIKVCLGWVQVLLKPLKHWPFLTSKIN